MANTYIVRRQETAETNQPDFRFLNFNYYNGATSGDNRALYLRQYLTGAGASGEAARVFNTVQNVVASSVHGQHTSLNFGASGSATGQAIAHRNTLHMPTTALPAGNVSYSAVQAEIYSDGSASDPAGNLLSFIRCVSGGDATGGADVDDDAALIDLSGVTIGSGNIVEASTTEANYSHSVRVRINGTNYYMMLASVAG